MADYKIKCEVVEIDEAKPRCQKVGNAYTIGGTTPGGMCCRAFHAVYPMVAAMRFADKIKWESEDGSVCVRCPDDNVLYRLARIREDV